MSATRSDRHAVEAPLCHIITPVGMMGYGFDENQTAHALTELTQSGVPTVIILDSGSTDSGPAKLALGSMTCPRSAYLDDLTRLLKLVDEYQVPLIFSSAGGDGTNDHVRVMEDIIKEIASLDQNQHYRLKVISIFSDINKTTVTERLKAGRISGCGTCVPELTEADVVSSAAIVAQIGYEPFTDAMEADADFDVIIGGRAYDPSPYAGYCVFQLKRQFPETSQAEIMQSLGGFLHMGKVMECGGQCSTPKSHGAIATISSNGHFDVRPLLSSSRCTPLTVAAHTLYENSRPDVLRGPGGSLHLKDCRYEQLADGRTVRVQGSVFQSSEEAGSPYQLKLEGARVTGYRSMFMGSVKDYILIDQIDELLLAVKKYVAQQHAHISSDWDLDFHIHGRGHHTPLGPGEIFIIVESIAATQQVATTIASKARVALIHGPYPGQKATSGNFAFGIGGQLEIELGACAKFCIYHLMELNPGEERLHAESLANTETQSDKLIRSEVKYIGNGTGKRPEQPPVIAPQTKPSPVIPSNTQNARPETLSDLARVLRSKNAGPYEITIDVMFNTISEYRAMEQSNLWSAETIAQILELCTEDIIWIGSFEPALAFKVTIPRIRAGKRSAAGGFMENDVHGSQQHNAIARIKLPESILTALGYL
ncbi:hypothetical protein HJFPF1_04039 [Paramyrothecium foliicola]|nr:hypothetical protein HJFPF1_04039 [Paramyrothecium foliicola]